MLRRIFKNRSLDRDLTDELQAHLNIEVDVLMGRGLSREEAIVEARRSFGNRTIVAERAREAWVWGCFDRLGQDLHYALRTLRRNVSFTVAAVLSLALGLGASTAVFSIADTVFLRPLPYPQPQKLMWVSIQFPSMKTEFLPSPDYVAWRRDNHVFEKLAATQAFAGESMLLGGPKPTEVQVVRVSSNFLATLGLHPALGRDFAPGEELPNGPKAVLISNSLWRTRFTANREVTGHTIVLDGKPYTVAGVLPVSFVFPMDVKVDVMATLPVSPTASHHDRSMSMWAVYGRLKPDATVSQARADLQRLFARSKADVPQMFRSDTKLNFEPLQIHRVGKSRRILSVLLGAVGCLLLITCANVSNLLLGRWSARSGELALRTAIGAGSGRLMRQLFTEAALLTVAGSAAGIALAFAMLHGFVHFAAGELPRLSEVTMDFRVFLIALLICILTTVALGALPALTASKIDIRQALEGAGRIGAVARFSWFKRALVVVQVALSLLLLSGAGLLFESLWHLRNDGLGFSPEHALSMTVPLKGTKLETRKEELAAGLVSFARQIPGTVDAARTECTPLSAGFLFQTFSRTDRPLPEAFHRGDEIRVCRAGDGYLKASGLRIVRGRFFTPEDIRFPNTLAVINQTAAGAYFPGEDPIGKRILGGPKKEWKAIIGVVTDSKNRGLDSPPAPQAFFNGFSLPDAPNMQFILRSIGDPQQLRSAMEAKLHSLDPGSIAEFRSLDQIIGEMTSGPRFNSILIGTFAALALLMAIVGVYGVLAFSVTQRTQEIGIRVALGADPSRVFAGILREGLTLVLLGVLAGLIGALILAHYLTTMLYGVSTTDPTTFLAVTLALIATAMFAASIPARRAATIDPVIALRHS